VCVCVCVCVCGCLVTGVWVWPGVRVCCPQPMPLPATTNKRQRVSGVLIVSRTDHLCGAVNQQHALRPLVFAWWQAGSRAGGDAGVFKLGRQP
jgi:hypothetical protein